MSPYLDALLESLIRFARADVRVTSLTFKERSYLLLAREMQVHHPGAPRRCVMLPPDYGQFNDPISPQTTSSYAEVVVGDSFEIHGPNGKVTIRCEVP